MTGAEEQRPLPGKLSGAAATWAGALTAVIAFVGPQLPADTPEWVRLGVGAAGAALAFLGGYSHPGYGKASQQQKRHK